MAIAERNIPRLEEAQADDITTPTPDNLLHAAYFIAGLHNLDDQKTFVVKQIIKSDQATQALVFADIATLRQRIGHVQGPLGVKFFEQTFRGNDSAVARANLSEEFGGDPRIATDDAAFLLWKENNAIASYKDEETPILFDYLKTGNVPTYLGSKK